MNVEPLKTDHKTDAEIRAVSGVNAGICVASVVALGFLSKRLSLT
jgi:hypothetical protein